MRGYQDSEDAERSEGGGEEDEEEQGEKKEDEGEEEGKEEDKEDEEEEEVRVGHQNCQIGKVLTVVKTVSGW